MKIGTKNDLEDVKDVMESLNRRLPDMKLSELIDVAARLQAVAKACKLIDEECKLQVKAKRKHVAGEVNGEIFKAILRIDSSTRLDQKALKEAEPEIHKQYCVEATTEVVTYAAR